MSPASAYALLASAYDAMPNPLLALEQRVAEQVMPDVRGRTVADIGCGTGRWSRRLAGRGARVIAVDRCREMLERAPAPAILADAMRLPLADNVADVVICAFTLSYVGPCLDELARITRPGGTVIVTDMHPVAAASGWTRSFRTADTVISVQSISYSLESLCSHLLRSPEILHARFGEPEREVFRRAGKPDLFAPTSAIPAVFVAKWVRRVD